MSGNLSKTLSSHFTVVETKEFEILTKHYSALICTQTSTAVKVIDYTFLTFADSDF